jgi:hypothetical protein
MCEWQRAVPVGSNSFGQDALLGLDDMMRWQADVTLEQDSGVHISNLYIVYLIYMDDMLVEPTNAKANYPTTQ